MAFALHVQVIADNAQIVLVHCVIVDLILAMVVVWRLAQMELSLVKVHVFHVMQHAQYVPEAPIINVPHVHQHSYFKVHNVQPPAMLVISRTLPHRPVIVVM
jgi:hypothetical protein